MKKILIPFIALSSLIGGVQTAVSYELMPALYVTYKYNRVQHPTEKGIGLTTEQMLCNRPNIRCV